jgi:hypothetical protein
MDEVVYLFHQQPTEIRMKSVKMFSEFKAGTKVRFISSVPTSTWNLNTGEVKRIIKGETGTITSRKIRYSEGLKFLELAVLFDESGCEYKFTQAYLTPTPVKPREIELA